jgi:isocitrate lyase
MKEKFTLKKTPTTHHLPLSLTTTFHSPSPPPSAHPPPSVPSVVNSLFRFQNQAVKTKLQTPKTKPQTPKTENRNLKPEN